MNKLALLLAPLLLGACDDPAPRPAAPPPSAPAPVASAARVLAAGPTIAASASPSKPSLQVQRMTLTSEVKQKEPVDELTAAAPGQRVWAHLAVRNRAIEPRRVSLIFYVGGEERSTVDLIIASSWSFRTWGYNTLRPTDKDGELRVELHDDTGDKIAEAKIPIRPSSASRPAKKPPAEE